MAFDKLITVQEIVGKPGPLENALILKKWTIFIQSVK